MIFLTKRSGNKIAVNPNHILFIYETASFDNSEATATWTTIVLTHGGGVDRTEVWVGESMREIAELIAHD